MLDRLMTHKTDRTIQHWGIGPNHDLLDFPSLNSWHTGFLNSIASETPGKTTGHNLVVGDHIASKITNMELHQTIEENSTREFRWTGPWHGIINGTHGFTFEEIDGGKGTRLTQWEEFSGAMSFFMKPSMPGGKKTAEGFVLLNGDLKKKAEEEVRKRSA
ncbi:MAG: hypothetical protein Q9160_003562 [Pyrenula sp. 1 TL-2023]